MGDFFTAAITILSPDGRLVRRWGRSGDGPGEFRSVQGLQVFAGGDSLLVFDRSASLLSIFHLGSSSLASRTRLADHTAVFPMDVWKLPSGELLADFAPAYTPRDDPNAPRTRLLRRLDATGYLVQDSVLEYPEQDRLVARDRGQISVRSHPFGRKSVVRPTGSGAVVVGWSGDSRVRLYHPDGGLRRTIAIGHPLQEIDPADAHEAAELVGQRHLRHLEESMPVHWPEFKYLQVDDRGRLWVAPFGADGTATRWTVLDSVGIPISFVRFPHDVDIRLIEEARIYGVARDSTDVPHLEIFTLREPLP